MLYFVCFWFILFLVYSFLGYIVEIINVSFIEKKFVWNRGFLIGPYLPIYGFGSLIMIFFLSRYQDDLLVLFIMSCFYCGVLEYFTSLFMEKIFKLRWWDYSDMKFNINGRVCLLNIFLFGIGGVIVVNFVQPFLSELLYMLPSTVTICLGITLFVIFLLDVIESFYITTKLKINFNRYLNKDATNKIKEEVAKTLRMNMAFTSRLLKAFPNFSLNNKFKEFMDLFNKTRKDVRIKKLKRKIKNVKKK